MTWQDIINEPSLANLPYKIETNEFGQVIMSPTVFLHGIYQSKIAELLRLHLQGFTSLETAVQTSKGTKVPDVTWFGEEFFLLHQDAADLPMAPPICVEIISKTNSQREIIAKRKLYFERGAEEVWTCDLSGNLKFYSANGEKSTSSLAPQFPQKIELMPRQ
jgi:Uma2 family endonuclease